MNQFYYKKIAIKDHDITFKKEKKTSWRRLEVNLKNYNLKLTEKFWSPLPRSTSV